LLPAWWARHPAYATNAHLIFCSSSCTTIDISFRKLPFNGNAEYCGPAVEQARQQITLWAGAVLNDPTSFLVGSLST
jgi:hypothetical protein